LKKPERAGSKQASGGSDDESRASPQKRSHKNREASAQMIGVLDDTPQLTHQMSSSFLKGTTIQEITELVSPRPSTACYFSSKLYDMRDIEKERNAEALKSGRMMSLDEEWEEGENDWVSGEEVEDEAEQCIIS